jgi:hypothetical protein
MGETLFGGVEEGGVTDVFTGYLPTQLKNLRRLSRLVEGQIGSGVSAYPDTYTPPPSPIQAEGFDFIQALLSGEAPLQGQATDVMSDFLGEYDPASATEYWETAVKKPMLGTWEEEILPKVMEPFVGAGAFDSGASRRAATESGRRLDRDIGGILGEILYRGEQAHEGRRAGAVGQALQYPLSLIGATQGPGMMQRQIEAEQLMEPYQKWMTAQPYKNPWLDFLPLILGTKPNEPIAQPTTVREGMLPDLIGGMGQMAGAALPFII